MRATGPSAKALKEAEVEDAILRQSQACHSESVVKGDRLNKAHANAYALMVYRMREFMREYGIPVNNGYRSLEQQEELERYHATIR